MAHVLSRRRPRPRLQGQALPQLAGRLVRCPRHSLRSSEEAEAWSEHRPSFQLHRAMLGAGRVLRAGDDCVLRELTGGPQELSVALTQRGAQRKVVNRLGVRTRRGD